MHVIVIRHAIAVERSPDGAADAERPLTPRGVKRMRAGAAGLARLVDAPEQLWTSPLVRAVETARILAAAWDGCPRPRVTELLEPGHEPGEVGRWLATLGAPSAALVGHEPGLSDLVSWLAAGGKAELALGKGGACLLRVETAGARPRGALEWLATPRMLRAIGA